MAESEFTHFRIKKSLTAKIAKSAGIAEKCILMDVDCCTRLCAGMRFKSR